jgi:hypothetical protein
MAAITWPRGDTFREDWKITKPSVQDIVIEGTPTGGTFTLAVAFADGTQTTDIVAYNATAGAVQSALENLQGVDSGDVTVTGGPGPGTAWTVTWATPYAPAMTATGTFTGGSQPKIYVRRQPFDLTGATLRWTVKSSVSQPDANAIIAHRWTHAGTISPAGCIAVATPANGKAIHTVTATETATLVPGTVYVYDTQLTDAGGDTTTVDSGTFQATADVTITVP